MENRLLSLDDIADLREYEREREEYRKKIIEEKKRRRVHVGTFQTFLFESKDTMRFQIQEMARVEKITTDEGIQNELETYNPLISVPGKLSATFFIELTSDDQLREWLPKLAGIERSYELHLDSEDQTVVIPGQLDDQHDSALTRDEVTACVHYLWFALTPPQVDMLETGPAKLVCVHPAYEEEAELSETTRNTIVKDLR